MSIIKNVKKLISSFRFFGLYIILYTLSSYISTIGTVITAKIITLQLFDERCSIRQVIFSLLILTVILVSSEFGKHYFDSRCNTCITDIRTKYSIDLYDKISNLSYCCIEDSEFLDKNQNVIMSVDSYNKGFQPFCESMYRTPSCFFVFISLIVLIAMNDLLSAIALLLSLLPSIFILKSKSTNTSEIVRSIGCNKRHQMYFYKTLNKKAAAKDIRIFNLKNIILSDYSNAEDKYLKSLNILYENKLIKKIIICILNYISIIVATALIVIRFYNGKLLVSDLVTYLQIILLIRSNFFQLADNLYSLTNEKSIIDSYYNFINTNPNKAFAMDLNRQLYSDRSRDWSIYVNNLYFSYSDKNDNILSNITFSANRGDRIAIVGINGAGKSTIIKLIAGIYQNYKGSIFLNGKELSLYKSYEKKKLVSVVNQKVIIYPCTIREYIMGNRCDFDEKLFNEVINEVGLRDKIERLYFKENTHLDKNFYPDAVELSGGEAQKLSIARALYSGSEIIILDEPFANLDINTEKKLYNELGEKHLNKTIIMVTHRLSSIKKCDNILLINNRELIEHGSFHELIMMKGAFYEMYIQQRNMYFK